MKLSDDYKSELSRLTLSEDFKAKLKEQCIAEAGLDKATEAEEEKTPEIQESKSGKIYKQMKVYRYVAIAACVVAAVSIVGGASIMSSVFSTTTRSSDSANEEMMELYDTDTDWEDDTAEDDPVEDTNWAEEDTEELEVDDMDIPEDSAVEYEDEEFDEAVEEPVEDTSLSSSVITANPASSYTPDDYDGEYNTEDYVLGGSNTSASNTATVYSSFSALVADVGYITYDYGDGDDADYEEPVEDSLDDGPYEDSYVPPSSSSGSALPEITTDYGTASSFYDILYNQMGDESETIGVSLVWITITGTPNASDVPAPTSGCYTLYSATITYDYLNSVSCDIDVYVWIKGTDDNQVKGMPTYEVGDELIVSLMLGENGCITVVDELIYDAYTLNGVDIAYHRVYGNVNPGSTDMGILPSEEEYYTTTSNNPAIYVHKASARELTRYIRRKVTGEGYNIADLEKISQYSMGLVGYSTFADNSSSEEETETSSDTKATLSINAGSSTSYFDLTAAGETIWLNDEASAVRLGELYSGSMTGTTTRTGISSVLFVGGHLRFSSETPFTGGVTEIEITSSGCPLDIKFRGIAVGDTLDEVKEKLSTSSVAVTDENLADDCVITINSDYGTVTLTVEYGVLAKIEIIG
ncbi:MAG: hypothetical protein LUH56_02295 [Oscillospiraceae bacterium]|nr:hypothetical protein [Oscillospiraceae bacterium]